MISNYEDIVIEEYTEINTITKLYIKQRPNEHPMAEIYATLNAFVNGDKLLNRLNSGKKIKIKHKTSILLGAEKNIFTGYVSEADIVNLGFESFGIKLKLIGGSSRLDSKIYERSFQNVTYTHREVIGDVLGNNSEFILEWNLGNERAIGMPVIQYLETNWEFIKRMASEYKMPIIATVDTDKTKLVIGIKRQSAKEIRSCDFSIGVSSKYYNLGGKKQGYNKAAFRYFRIKTKEMFSLGEKVCFQGSICYVCKIDAQLVGSELIYTYELGGRQLLEVRTMENYNLIGHTIKGTVLETKNETIKLDLDLEDDAHNVNEAYPYDWKPETGNILYCMPQKGTVTSLYFGDSKETSGIIVNCIRTNGDSSAKMEQPQEKRFRTENKVDMDLLIKKIMLKVPYPKEDSAFAKISIDDSENTSYIVADNAINIVAAQGIIFESQYFYTKAHKGEISVIGGMSCSSPSSLYMHYQIDYLGRFFSIKADATCTADVNRDGRLPNVNGILYPRIDDAPIVTKKSLDGLIGGIALSFATAALFAIGAVVTVAAIGLLTAGTVASGGVLGAVFLGAFVGGMACGTFQAVSMYNDDENLYSTDEYAYRCMQQAEIGAVVGAVSGYYAGASFARQMAIDAIGNVWGQVADDSFTKKDTEEILENAGIMAVVSVLTFGGWKAVKGLSKILGKKAVEEVFEREIVGENVKKTVKESMVVIDAGVGLTVRSIGFGRVKNSIDKEITSEKLDEIIENNNMQTITEGLETKSKDIKKQSDNRVDRATEFSDWVKINSKEFKLVEEY